MALDRGGNKPEGLFQVVTAAAEISQTGFLKSREFNMDARPATPSVLELIVNARISTFLMGLEIMLDRVESEAFCRHRIDAWRCAEQAGYLSPKRPVPAMLEGKYDLPDAWQRGLERYEEENVPYCLQYGE